VGQAGRGAGAAAAQVRHPPRTGVWWRWCLGGRTRVEAEGIAHKAQHRTCVCTSTTVPRFPLKLQSCFTRLNRPVPALPLAVCCSAIEVWHLQRVLLKKRDPLSHTLFLDVVAPKESDPLPLERFW
jgi:hypothetical protein